MITSSLIVIIIVLSALITTQYYYFEKTAPFASEAGNYVMENTPDDNVLVVVGSVAPPYAFYSKRTVLNNFSQDNIMSFAENHLGTLIVRYKVINNRTLFLFSEPYTEGAWDSYLESNANLVKEFIGTETNLLLTRTYIVRIYSFD